jgi:periodic tryptophan protein 2
MALSLNEKPLMKKVIESTPTSEVALVVRSLPPHRLQRLLTFISSHVDTSPHLEFYLTWAQTLLTIHGRHLKKISHQMLQTFRSLQKTLTRQHKDIAKM